jgi:LmbE family N-acetylglucosaminyl deacetylase
MILDKSSPIIVPVDRFLSFPDYLASLSRSSANDFKNQTLKLNEDLTYHDIPFYREECAKWMQLWEECNGWRWADSYNIDNLQNLHNRGVLRCFKAKLGKEDLAYHFVFKWGRYVYCNSPLYNTKELKKREVGKWMWLNLIKFSIENKWVDYVDLMGPEGLSTFGEVIDNRCHTDKAGDFGYKWKFIPKEIKNGEDCTLDHLEISTEKTFCWKGVSLPPKPTKLLVVCHPDDEAIFFGDWLMGNGRETKVVCLTSSMDHEVWHNDKSRTRFKELQDSLRVAGVSYFECLEQTPSLNNFENRGCIEAFLNRVKNETDWDTVVTHNQYGEYGHMQHVEAHEMVKEIFPNEKIYVYKNSDQKLPSDRKQALLDQHVSQQKYGINEIRGSEWTGSDWYKHTVGKNMIDYESIERLEDTKTSYQIVCFWGDEETDNTTFDFIKKLNKKLDERGHRSIISRVFNSWPWSPDIFIVSTLQDAEKCIEEGREFFFIIEDEAVLNDGNFEEYGKIVDKSKKSFTRTYKIRNLIGDRVNLVFVPRARNWYNLIRKIEAHLLMGLIAPA